RVARHDRGYRHRRTDPVFQHQGSSQRVRDAGGGGVVSPLYSQGHHLPSADQRGHRFLPCRPHRPRRRRGDGGYGVADRHDAGTHARTVRGNGRHVRGIGDRGDRAGHAYRSCNGIHPMTEPVIEAVDVVKFLGKGAGQVQALRGVSLALRGGELTLLMGPSGSGKTTLLSILGCMMAPTQGTVRVGGRCAEGAGAEELAKLRREHVGFIFQSYHLFPTLTAADNVRLALDVRGENSARAVTKAKEALAMVGLAHKNDAYPLELSGGEQQRVAVARGVVGKPADFPPDEPTAALDSENGTAIMTLLAEIAKDPA